MAITKKERARKEREKVEYEWGTLWPQWYNEKMNWGKGFRTKGDVDILFLAGSTGRDPLQDGPCRTPEEERAGKGKVVGGIKEQTRAALMEIKNSVEIMGGSLKNIVFFNEENILPEPDRPFDDPGVFEESRRPNSTAYTVVNRYERSDGKGGPVYRKLQCNHCNEPACATACPARAYRKTPEGAVAYDEDLCFGCRYCMTACPFNVPAHSYESAFEPKIVKCTFCYPRIKKGLVPACADACQAGALTFGKRSDLIKLARDKIGNAPGRYIDHIYGEREAGGTSWMYLSGVPFGDVGFPTDLPKPVCSLKLALWQLRSSAGRTT